MTSKSALELSLCVVNLEGVQSEARALPPATDNAEQRSGFLPKQDSNAPWSVAAIELLRAKWKKGLSARAIAELLCASGHPATKNSVLGKARRLGLGVHDNAIWTKATLKIKPKPLIELSDKGCRWPIGHPNEPGFRFCNSPEPVPGKPYCADHCAIAFRKPEPHEVVKVKPQRAGTILLRMGA